ncbi:thioredoxin family protein [Candidatus Collierbacteria bacterium]|nr:thioredoxin family protein [Candidatus Collierbacteria bacterium]
MKIKFIYLFGIALLVLVAAISFNGASKKEIAGEGAVLAGKKSYLYVFAKKAYEEALASDKTILLYFYANWCPVCRGEQLEIFSGFDELDSDSIIGFRVNFDDSETDKDEEALAREFRVTYQHTKIILKNGKEVSRSDIPWDKEEFLKELNTK